ncbi:transposase [Sphingobacterium sp. LRF_L2]|uniref:transposase n=1 Tax=Sphingobacterium sp. LRF_L2 TaxID=3369421 RepID=UPI003F640DEB
MNKLDQALSYYKQRLQIETLFRAMKTSGFNLEDTHPTALDKLEKLILLTMIAFLWCYKVEDYIDQELKPKSMKEEPNLYSDMNSIIYGNPYYHEKN